MEITSEYSLPKAGASSASFSTSSDAVIASVPDLSSNGIPAIRDPAAGSLGPLPDAPVSSHSSAASSTGPHGAGGIAECTPGRRAQGSACVAMPSPTKAQLVRRDRTVGHQRHNDRQTSHLQLDPHNRPKYQIACSTFLQCVMMVYMLIQAICVVPLYNRRKSL